MTIFELPPHMSWPGWHWWITLSAEEQGSWVSGIGALAAIFVTVVGAWATVLRTKLEEKDRQRRRAKILASELVDVLLLTASQVRLVTRLATDRKDIVASEGRIAFVKELKFDVSRLPHGSVLEGLPLDLMEALSNLNAAVRAMNLIVVPDDDSLIEMFPTTTR
jgi:hypothetical protein